MYRNAMVPHTNQISHREWFQSESSHLSPRQISLIDSHIAVSDFDHAFNPNALKASGIKSIVSLYTPFRFDLELARYDGAYVVDSLVNESGEIHPEVIQAGIERVVVCELEESSHNQPEQLKKAVVALSELANHHAPVLVHCHAGLCRAPAVAAAYLATRDGVTFKEALKKVSSLRRVGLTAPFVSSLVRALNLPLE